MFKREFVGRCLSFDDRAANEHAALVATRNRHAEFYRVDLE